MKTKRAAKKEAQGMRVAVWTPGEIDCIRLRVSERAREAFVARCEADSQLPEFSEEQPDEISFLGLEGTEWAMNAQAEISGIDVLVLCYRHYVAPAK